jgi:hypothetical protein
MKHTHLPKTLSKVLT